MSGRRICIAGGHIVDQTRDEVGDLWIEDGRIIAPPGVDCGGVPPGANHGDASVQTSMRDAVHNDTTVIDASGCLVLPGAIDLHTHIGGGKLSIARMLMQPDPDRDRYLPVAPEVSRRYAQMGYTTCFEPAVLPSNAAAAHFEMSLIDAVDTGGYVVLGNEEPLLAMIADDVDDAVIDAYVTEHVDAAAAIAVKVVNPGGIDAFKFNRRELNVDQKHPKYDVTPGQIVRRLAAAVRRIGLAHPLHVHASNLGVPGNIESTLATVAAADGLPLHLTHVQFHSYGRRDSGMSSAAARLSECVNANPQLTIDVGQVMFGQTVTLSADTMHQHANLIHASPKRGMIVDVDCQSGCGVVPFRYRDSHFVHALQWAIGLEIFLMVEDSARVFLTTDHPNGGPMTSYPHLMRLLGDRSFRDDALSAIDPGAAAASSLRGIDRQYELRDLVATTRGGPADALGLADRGHLRPGARADVAVYDRNATIDATFQDARLVLRQGGIVHDRDGAYGDLPKPPRKTILAADLGRRVDDSVHCDHQATVDQYHRRFDVPPPRSRRVSRAAFEAMNVNTTGMDGCPVESSAR